MRWDDAATVVKRNKIFWRKKKLRKKRMSKGSSCFVYVLHGVPTCLFKNVNI